MSQPCKECESLEERLSEAGLCGSCAEDSDNFSALAMRRFLQASLEDRKGGGFPCIDYTDPHGLRSFLTVERWGRSFNITIEEEA